uniref:Uncharacterized protein n=1 Tax=Ditylenchus dipsaci TaxID=166011 RepID=A0A915D4B5_9BILA
MESPENVKKQSNEIGIQKKLISDEQEKSNPTPDQILSHVGAKNAYVLFVWLAMSMGWFLAAGPMMVSAFIMGEPCILTENFTSSTNCVFEDGHLPKSITYLEIELNSQMRLLQHFYLKGRRVVVVLCMFSAGFIGCISIFSPNIYVFIASRFFQGSFFTGLGTTPGF